MKPATQKTWHWTAADKLFQELVREARRGIQRDHRQRVQSAQVETFLLFCRLATPAEGITITATLVFVQDLTTLPRRRTRFHYKGWWGVDTLPEFANNEARATTCPSWPEAAILDGTKRWMDQTTTAAIRRTVSMVGGTHFVANGAVRDLARRHAARQINPGCYTVAEVWENRRQFLEEAGFSATMNLRLRLPDEGVFNRQGAGPSGAAR